MLSTLALRAGWGLQGNQAVRAVRHAAAAQGERRRALSVRHDASRRASSPRRSPTRTSSGRRRTQINVGLDYGFKNDRITGIIEFYQKTTKDLLLEVSVPQPAVVSTRLENIGRVRNRGVEASLDASPDRDGRHSLTARPRGSPSSATR